MPTPSNASLPTSDNRYFGCQAGGLREGEAPVVDKASHLEVNGTAQLVMIKVGLCWYVGAIFSKRYLYINSVNDEGLELLS